MDLHLKDKVALVLASSSGLGKAVAQALVQEGAKVVIASRSESKLAQAVSDLTGQGEGQVKYKVFDQKDYQSIKDLVDFTREAFGKINILVANSGGPKAGDFESFSDEEVQEAFQLTLNSYIRVIRLVLPDLKESQGRILLNSSSSIKQPISGLSLSNIFRTGILGLAKTLAQELAPHGVLVNLIGPGRIETDRIKELNQINANQAGQPLDEYVVKDQADIPLGRYGKPEEFAQAAAFLVSGANTYITGQSLLVDGGLVKAL